MIMIFNLVIKLLTEVRVFSLDWYLRATFNQRLADFLVSCAAVTSPLFPSFTHSESPCACIQ